MTFKCPRPEERAGAAASASSAAAAAFYDDGQSASYTTPANAAIQKDLTRHALALLRFGVSPVASSAPHHDARDSGDKAPWLLLDLGAGSGLSTLAANDWLLEHGLLGFTLAFDISASMLSLTTAGSHADAEAASSEKSEQPLTLQRAEFYRGNAAQKFPLRAGVFHAAIGISMLQWLTREGLETCFASLYAQLSSAGSGGGRGRAVFQVYPPSLEYVELMEQTARAMGFAYAEVFVSFPHATTAKKWFFCVETGGASTSSSNNSTPEKSPSKCAGTLCLFGRRFDRKCAWHLLQRSESNASTAALRERLGKEHVKTAWHIWRKFRRSVTTEAQTQETPLHAKAKRSLALWTSDEVIGKALQSAFLPPLATDVDDTARAREEYEVRAKAVTYEAFVLRMDEVVDTFHSVRSCEREIGWSVIIDSRVLCCDFVRVLELQAYTEAVQIERSVSEKQAS